MVKCGWTSRFARQRTTSARSATVKTRKSAALTRRVARPGGGEHLEGPAEVQHLHVVEDENPYIQRLISHELVSLLAAAA